MYSLMMKGSPLPGFLAVLMRGLLNSLFLFLPLTLFGSSPSMESYLSFVPTYRYYLFLSIITPAFFIVQWLYLVGFIYLLLRLLKRPCPFDFLLNMFGIISLIMGILLFFWDWLWVIKNCNNYMLLGVSHLLFNLGFLVMITTSLERVGVEKRIGLILSVIYIVAGLPLAILIMRSPL